MMLAPVLTPHGLLMLAQSLEAEGEAPALEPERGLRLEKAFARGAGHGLLCSWAPTRSGRLFLQRCPIGGNWGRAT